MVFVIHNNDESTITGRLRNHIDNNEENIEFNEDNIQINQNNIASNTSRILELENKLDFKKTLNFRSIIDAYEDEFISIKWDFLTKQFSFRLIQNVMDFTIVGGQTIKNINNSGGTTISFSNPIIGNSDYFFSSIPANFEKQDQNTNFNFQFTTHPWNIANLWLASTTNPDFPYYDICAKHIGLKIHFTVSITKNICS